MMKIGLIAAAFAVCAVAANAETLTVEGDSASYEVIELTVAENGNKEITTSRSEAGASTFTKHEVSCDPYRAGVMGQGGTIEAMNENAVSDVELGEIIRDSAEDMIAGYACEN